MASIKQKVKDILTPGHQTATTDGAYPNTTTGTGTGYNTTTAGTTGYGNTGVANTAATATNATNASGYGQGGVVSGASQGVRSEGMVRVPGYQEAPVNVGEQYFTVKEDHYVEKERREKWVEHQPVEREYVTSVQATGKAIEGGVTAGAARATERELQEHTAFNTGTTTVQGVQGNPESTGTGLRM